MSEDGGVDRLWTSESLEGMYRKIGRPHRNFVVETTLTLELLISILLQFHAVRILLQELRHSYQYPPVECVHKTHRLVPGGWFVSGDWQTVICACHLGVVMLWVVITPFLSILESNTA